MKTTGDRRLANGDDWSLEADYAHCQRLARRTARNFYYAFLVLPRPQRMAMGALYAFFRLTDDIADAPGPEAERRSNLDRWRQRLDASLAGTPPCQPPWLALADTVRQYEIPPALLHAVVAGVGDDLTVSRYATFADLYHYCYQVASAVGLACLRVWGVHDRRAELPAEWCGIAFQLTNILRDVREDFARGRVYFPLEEIRRYGVREAELGDGRASEAVVKFLRFQVCRAQSYYDRAAALDAYLEPPARAVHSAMVRIYRGLLAQIERDPAVVLRRRVRLSVPRKLAILLSSFRLRFSPKRPARA